MELTPGEVWWARPDPTIGREQAGRRPVLVVAGEEYVATVTTSVLVVPLTTTDRRWPNHVRLRGAVGMAQATFAMTEQVRAISRERLITRVGVASVSCLEEARGWIIDYVRD